MAFKDQKIQKKSQSSRIKKEKKKRSVEAWAELRSRLKTKGYVLLELEKIIEKIGKISANIQ